MKREFTEDNYKFCIMPREELPEHYALESVFPHGRKVYPTEMTVWQMICKLFILLIKHGNIKVKTWLQYQGFVNLYEPRYFANQVEKPFVCIF